MSSYLFTPIPGSHFEYYTAFLIAAAALFLAGFILNRMMTKNKALKKSIKTTPKLLTWSGILLALFLAFRYERIPYFSMRFIFFVLLALIALAVVRGIYLYVKRYKKEAQYIHRPESTTRGSIYSTKKK
ncbi:MAG: hypothetical protein ABH856_04010 [Patescibacteria group bacterium]